MESTNQPSSPQPPNEAVLAIEARLDKIEQRMAEGFTSLERGTGKDRPLGRDELSAELEHHRDQLRDYEKALVERIADVDDDRRATASRLQRAWNTQREEIEDRLRRNIGLFGGLLLLFAILFAVALFLVYRQATLGQPELAAQIPDVRRELSAELAGVRQELAAEVTDIREALAGSSVGGAVTDRFREKLEGLTAKVGEMGSSLKSLDRIGERATQASLAAEHASREAENRLAAEIDRLNSEQKHLAEALKSLQAALKTFAAGRSDALVGAGAETGNSAMASTASGPIAAADAGQAMPAGEDKPAAVEQSLPLAQAREAGSVEAEDSGSSADEESDAGISGSGKTTVVAEDSYALQLIGFFSRKSLDDFVARAELPPRVYSLRQIFRGRPWHVLIHSLYEDHASAEEALTKLPSNLAALAPWIRPLSKGTELEIIETGPVPE